MGDSGSLESCHGQPLDPPVLSILRPLTVRLTHRLTVRFATVAHQEIDYGMDLGGSITVDLENRRSGAARGKPKTPCQTDVAGGHRCGSDAHGNVTDVDFRDL